MTKLPENKEPVLRMVPMPADANQHGDIFGGWIMAQVDVAGGVLAARHARGRVATGPDRRPRPVPPLPDRKR